MLQAGDPARLVRILAIVGPLRLRGGRGGVRPHPRRRRGRVEAGPAGGHRAGDGDPARGVPGGADGLPRARRLADLAQPGAHEAHAGARDARRGHRALRRQDRHAHPEPDDAARAGGGGLRPDPRGPGTGPPGGAAHACSRARDPGQQARPLRPDGARAAQRGRAPAGRTPSTCTPRWSLAARVPADGRAPGREPRLASATAVAALATRGQGRAGGGGRAVPPRAGAARALARRGRAARVPGAARAGRRPAGRRSSAALPEQPEQLGLDARGPARLRGPAARRRCPPRSRSARPRGCAW